MLIVAGGILPGLVAAIRGKQIAALFADEGDLCVCHILCFSSGECNRERKMIWSREHGEVSDVNLTASEKNWYVRGV